MQRNEEKHISGRKERPVHRRLDQGFGFLSYIQDVPISRQEFEHRKAERSKSKPQTDATPPIEASKVGERMKKGRGFSANELVDFSRLSLESDTKRESTFVSSDCLLHGRNNNALYTSTGCEEQQQHSYCTMHVQQQQQLPQCCAPHYHHCPCMHYHHTHHPTYHNRSEEQHCRSDGNNNNNQHMQPTHCHCEERLLVGRPSRKENMEWEPPNNSEAPHSGGQCVPKKQTNEKALDRKQELPNKPSTQTTATATSAIKTVSLKLIVDKPAPTSATITTGNAGAPKKQPAEKEKKDRTLSMKREPSLVVRLDLGGGVQRDLLHYEEDDPMLSAKVFCQLHSFGGAGEAQKRVIEALAALIRSNLEPN